MPDRLSACNKSQWPFARYLFFFFSVHHPLELFIGGRAQKTNKTKNEVPNPSTTRLLSCFLSCFLSFSFFFVSFLFFSFPFPFGFA